MHKRRVLNDVNTTIILFLVPAFILYIVFVVIPIFKSLEFSFFRWDGLGAMENFVAFDNYISIFKDRIFWGSFSNNLFLVFFSIITQMPFAILLAIALTSKIKGKSFLRTMYFAPQIISTVATGYLFYYIFEPTFGLLNETLKLIGLQNFTQGWLGEPKLALLSVLFVISWRFVGFYMVLFMAAIEGISNELFEAARIDGCTKFQVVRKITLPLLSGTLKTACILSIVGSIKYFDLVWIMTAGGPAHASELIATYMYKKTFLSWEMGYGSALAFILFIIAFSLSIIFMRLTSSRQDKK